MIKANSNIVLTEEEKSTMKRELTSVFGLMLKTMKFDITDPQIEDTPNRMASMYVDELLEGSYNVEPKITQFPNIVNSGELVFLGPISIKSMCSHHFIPFVGEVYIAYKPKEKVVGISKLCRVVDWFMRRPQIQEELTQQICEYLHKKLECDVIVHMEATHMCMTHRGVRQSENARMITTHRSGITFTHDAKQDFFNYVQRSKS